MFVDGNKLNVTTITQGGGGNPFDQDLNTTSDVTFNSIVSTTDVNANYFYGDGSGLTNLPSPPFDSNVVKFVYDDLNVVSVDGNARTLKKADGTVMLNWENVDYAYGVYVNTLQTDSIFPNTPGNALSVGSNGDHDITFSTVKDSSNNTTLDSQNRTLYAADGTTQILNWDSTNGIYGGGSPTGFINLSSGKLISYPGATPYDSLDYVDRKVFADDGATVTGRWDSTTTGFGVSTLSGLDVSGNYATGMRFLSDVITLTPGSNVIAGYINSWLGTISDASDETSINWQNRSLYASDGETITASWYDGQLKAGLNAVDIINGVLIRDNAPQLPSLDWYNKKLYANDGTTVAADWTGGGWGNGWLQTYGVAADPVLSATVSSVDLVTGQLSNYDGDTDLSLDWQDRTLYAADGTTPTLNWNDLNLQGNWLLNGTPITITTDTNWETSWSTFDANMKATYSPIDLNTYHTNITRDTNEVTGFPIDGRTITTMTTYDNNGWFSICPTGTDFNYWYKNTLVNVVGCQGVQIPNITQLNYIYFNDTSGTLKISAIPWSIANYVQVSTVYWDNNYHLMTDERHGLVMDSATHEYLHFTEGTRYGTGLIGSFGANDFNITSGRIYDEDIGFNISGTSVGRLLKRNVSLSWDVNTIITKPFYESAGVLQYDNAGTMTDVSNAQYTSYWVMGATDLNTPIYIIMGQRQDTTLSNAQSNQQFSALSLTGLPVNEIKLLYRVIVKRTGGNESVEDVTDYRSSALNGATTTTGVTAHNLLSNLNWSASGHTIDSDVNFAQKNLTDVNAIKLSDANYAIYKVGNNVVISDGS